VNNLAVCNQSQGEYGKAVRLYQEALAMRRRLLPEDHPDIADSLNNLAICNTSQALRLKEMRAMKLRTIWHRVCRWVYRWLDFQVSKRRARCVNCAGQ
jgi:tetratricopeptide (TPR) repeat protein